jgi:cysteine desulfurase/selenocysteine lyase
MKAGIELIQGIGIDRIAARLLELKSFLVARLENLGFQFLGARSGASAHAITTCQHPTTDHAKLHAKLGDAGIVSSLRQDRAGRSYLRFSPHFYNTETELDRVAEVLRQSV